MARKRKEKILFTLLLQFLDRPVAACGYADDMIVKWLREEEIRSGRTKPMIVRNLIAQEITKDERRRSANNEAYIPRSSSALEGDGKVLNLETSGTIIGEDRQDTDIRNVE